MKSHNEMYQSLLSRYNEYQEKKQKRIRTLRRIAPVLACFVIALGLGLVYWKHFDKTPIIPSDLDIVEVTTEAVTSAVTGNVTTVSTGPATTKTSRVSATTTSISTVTEAHTQAMISDATRPVTTKVQTTSAIPHMVTITSSVVTQTSSEGGNASFEYTTTSSNGEDMGLVYTTTSNGDDVSIHTTTLTVTTEPVTTTTTDSGDNNTPPQPMNEKYPLGFLDGDITMYRNTYRISSDNVGEYIGIAGMRGLGPIYNAKAFKIKNIEATVAIAVKFEEDEGYYLYRNNNTSIDTIKELISPEE